MTLSVRAQSAVLLVLSVGVSVLFAEWFVRSFVSVRDVGPAFTVYDPYFGKVLKPSFSTQRLTPEFRMRLTTNALGFRGRQVSALPSDPLLFLGDSFTLGYGVSDGDEFPARIDKALHQRFESRAPVVVNAGIGDSGNGFWVKYLRRHAHAMTPRLVVLQVLDNDFNDNVTEGLFSLTADGALRELPVPPPGVARRVQRIIESVPGLANLHLVGLARQVRWPRLGPKIQAVAAEPAPSGGTYGELLTYRLVGESLDLGLQRGWKMLGVLVGLPPARRRGIEEEFARRGLPVVHLSSKQERPDLYFTVDGHWNEKGHEQAAAQLLAAVEALGIELAR